MAYHGPKGESQWMGLATLIGVGAILMISFSNWREIDRIQESLDGQLSQIDARITQISEKIDKAPAAKQAPRSGPDPNKAYDIKTSGAPIKGPANAPVTIAEFSDFQ